MSFDGTNTVNPEGEEISRLEGFEEMNGSMIFGAVIIFLAGAAGLTTYFLKKRKTKKA